MITNVTQHLIPCSAYIVQLSCDIYALARSQSQKYVLLTVQYLITQHFQQGNPVESIEIWKTTFTLQLMTIEDWTHNGSRNVVGEIYLTHRAKSPKPKISIHSTVKV